MEKLVAMDHDITVSEKLVVKQNEIDINDRNYIGRSGSKDIRSFKKLWQILAVIMAIDLLVLFVTLILYNFVDTTGSRKDSQEFISTNSTNFVTKIIWISYGLSTMLKMILFLVYHPWSSMKCKNMFPKSYKGCKSGLDSDVQQVSQEHESMMPDKAECQDSNFIKKPIVSISKVDTNSNSYQGTSINGVRRFSTISPHPMFKPDMIPFKTDLISYTKKTLNNWTYIHCDFHLHIYEDSIQEFKIRLEKDNQYVTIQDYDFLHKLDNFIKDSIGEDWKQGLISIHLGFHLYMDPYDSMHRFKFQLEEDGTDVVIEDKSFLQKLDDFCNNRTKLWIG